MEQKTKEVHETVFETVVEAALFLSIFLANIMMVRSFKNNSSGGLNLIQKIFLFVAAYVAVVTLLKYWHPPGAEKIGSSLYFAIGPMLRSFLD